MKAKALNLKDTEVPNPLQVHDDGGTPITLSLLAQYQELSDQLHIDRIHTASQALDAATDRLNLLDDLISSPSLHPLTRLIPQIQLRYSEELAVCKRKVKVFIAKPVPPGVGPQVLKCTI